MIGRRGILSDQYILIDVDTNPHISVRPSREQLYDWWTNAASSVRNRRPQTRHRYPARVSSIFNLAFIPHSSTILCLRSARSASPVFQRVSCGRVVCLDRFWRCRGSPRSPHLQWLFSTSSFTTPVSWFRRSANAMSPLPTTSLASSLSPSYSSS